MAQRILVTAALPYANGSVHIGHMLEHIQVDIFTRAQRLLGRDAVFLCADDTHGTPIEVNARKKGVTPEALVAQSFAEHTADFKDFLIQHDHYGSTNSEENRHYAELFYARLKAAGHIFTRDVDQLYCQKDQRFLPDRFIRGTCPRCKAPEQYGDTCEACSHTYDPVDLVDARCALCGETPVQKRSSHYFYDLPKQAEAVKRWMDAEGHLQPDVRNFVETWFKEGLRAWDISRDGPYFGFKIPGEDNKYFYVWLDAPIGYVSTTAQYCALSGRRVEDYWQRDSEGTRIFHFIGKDIIYFHALFWPAMLESAGFRLPDSVHVHGMLTVDGVKMSKSRGTFINARTYLRHLPPELLRYYLCTKLTARVEDVDLNLEDFLNRCNADLVNSLSNLYSRAVPFVHGKLGGALPTLAQVDDPQARAVVEAFVLDGLPEVGRLYDAREFGAVTRRVMELVDFANKYIQDRKPWDQLKTNPAAAGSTLSVALHVGKLAAVALWPVMPKFSDTVARMLGLHDGPALWLPTLDRDGKADLGGPGKTYGPFIRLCERVERKQIDAILQEGAQGETAPAVAAAPPATAVTPVRATVAMEDFAKLDLRVGVIKAATLVEGADKLLQLTVDLGPLGMRNVFAGIRKSYAPESLSGQRVVVVANLAPRTMKFGVSEAMVLAADADGGSVLLAPHKDAPPGAVVR